MNILECEIEEIISSNLKNQKGRNSLLYRGLHFADYYDKYYQQVKLGSYGRLDLIGVRYNHSDRSYEVGVIEIKKDVVDVSTLLQAVRYCKGIERLFSKYDTEIGFNIHLVGKTICKSDFCYLSDVVKNVSVTTFSIDLNSGITFNNAYGYFLTSENLFDPDSLLCELKEVTRLGIKRHIKEPIF